MIAPAKRKKQLNKNQSEKVKKSGDGKVIAVIGYGGQGRSLALNLRDSGYRVLIALRSRSRSRNIAKSDRFTEILTIRQAVLEADIICFAFPDHLHGRVFTKDIEPYLKSGSMLWFLHGFSIHFNFVNPTSEHDIILIAPHAPGIAVRQVFLADKSLSAFYAVERDFSGNAKQEVIKLSLACGFKRKNLIKTSFEDEAIGDLFGEQVVLCGGLTSLIKNGFEVLVEHGLKPENAYLEVCYQLDLIIKLIKEYGIEGMYSKISVAAQYGSLLAGPKIIDESVKKRMKNQLSEITSGAFPKRLNCLEPVDVKVLKKDIKQLSNKDFEKVSKKFSPLNRKKN